MSQNILITGASRGIGAATARLAGQRGWSVCVNYISDRSAAESVVSEIKSQGGNAVAIRADIANIADITQMFADAEREIGPLDALVNNAGVTGPIGRFTNVKPEIIRRVLEVNTLGLMVCAQEAVRRFSTAMGGRGGTIVNISSIAATLGAPGEYVHYAASKAAVEAFTIGLAKEFAAEGIRVNAVSPGSTLTDIHATAGEPDRPARVAPRIPMGRLGQPEEIAEAILWLLSDAASYTTGAILRCSGGI